MFKPKVLSMSNLTDKLIKKKEIKLQEGEQNVVEAPKTQCWTKAGLLSRIRSDFTCTGSSDRCNPLISLLCASLPGSQVVPIWPSWGPGGRRETACLTTKASGCDLQWQQNMTRQSSV